MRSDRHPYFFLKNSRDPVVQQLLSDAETMTVSEIQKMNVKPDIRKAMMFVHAFGAQTRSQTTAELLAQKMIQQSPPRVTTAQEYDIFKYTGSACELEVKPKHWLMQPGEFLFMRDQHRIYASHNWMDLGLGRNYIVVDHAELIGHGCVNVYNQMCAQHVKDKYKL